MDELFERISSFSREAQVDPMGAETKLMTYFNSIEEVDKGYIESFVNNSLTVCINFTIIDPRFVALTQFTPLLILHIVMYVVDDLNYDISCKKDLLLKIGSAILDDNEGKVYNFNCFYVILHLFLSINDDRFLHLLDKYICLLNEDNFTGIIGENLFDFFWSHKSEKAQALHKKYSNPDFDRLALYLS